MTHRTLPLLLVLLLGIGLVACRDSQLTQEKPVTEVIEDWVPAAEAANVVTVHLNEYGFESDRDTFVVGVPYEFQLVNDGAVAHEWAVVPRGDLTEDAMLIEVEEDDLPKGGSFDVTFAFPTPGAYDFVCFMEEPVPHAAAGMRIPITVIDAKG